MNSFKLDLGLERFEKVDRQEDSIYLGGGIKITAGDLILTSFEEINDNSPFLGAYTDIIWQNIASNAIKLVEEDIIEFNIMTEGWDPIFEVERKDRGLVISMSENSAQHPDIEVPKEYVDGVIVSENQFFSEIRDSGNQLREFYKQRGTSPPHITDFEPLLSKLKDLEEK